MDDRALTSPPAEGGHADALARPMSPPMSLPIPIAVPLSSPSPSRSSRARPLPFERVDIRVYLLTQVLLVSASLAVAAHTMQAEIDPSVSRLFFDTRTHSFGLGESVWLEILGHQAARALPVIVGAFALAAGIACQVVAAWRPWRRILFTLGAAVVIGPALISLLKASTTAHCPHDMQMFGGVIDDARERAGPFWAASSAAAGHCLPSGHAGGGYALVALYFAGWAAGRPAWRRRGMLIGVGAGLLFSAVRVMQGAHFPSQTVWSAAVDWAVASLLFLPLLAHWPTRSSDPAPSPQRPAAAGRAGDSPRRGSRD